MLTRPGVMPSYSARESLNRFVRPEWPQSGKIAAAVRVGSRRGGPQSHQLSHFLFFFPGPQPIFLSSVRTSPVFELPTPKLDDQTLKPSFCITDGNCQIRFICVVIGGRVQHFRPFSKNIKQRKQNAQWVQ